MAARIRASGEAAREPIDHVLSALEFDPAAADHPDHDLLASGEDSLLQHADVEGRAS